MCVGGLLGGRDGSDATLEHDTGLTASNRIRMMSAWFFSAAKVKAVSPVPLECMQMWSSEGS